MSTKKRSSEAKAALKQRPERWQANERPSRRPQKVDRHATHYRRVARRHG